MVSSNHASGCSFWSEWTSFCSACHVMILKSSRMLGTALASLYLLLNVYRLLRLVVSVVVSCKVWRDAISLHNPTGNSQTATLNHSASRFGRGEEIDITSCISQGLTGVKSEVLGAVVAAHGRGSGDSRSRKRSCPQIRRMTAITHPP